MGKSKTSKSAALQPRLPTQLRQRLPDRQQGRHLDFREMAVNVSTTVWLAPAARRPRVRATLSATSVKNKVILDWAVADYNFSPLLGIPRWPRSSIRRASTVRRSTSMWSAPMCSSPTPSTALVMRDFSAAFNGAHGLTARSTPVKGFVDYKVILWRHSDVPAPGRGRLLRRARPLSGTGPTSLGMESVYGGQAGLEYPGQRPEIRLLLFPVQRSGDGWSLAPAPMFNAYSQHREI